MKTLIVVSGYFNPIHIGHLKLLQAAKASGDKLLVIVNNDTQQLFKKYKIIMNEIERMEIIKAIRYVGEVVLSIDVDPSVIKTLEKIAIDNPEYKIIFSNGGDRDSIKEIPEGDICKKYNIKMRFGVGGFEKLNSSSNINKLMRED